MDEALYALITSFSEITDMVDDRVFPIVRDQGSDVPAITYQTVSSPRKYDDDGMTRVDVNYDLHIYSHSRTETQKLKALLEEKLSGASGVFQNKTIDYVTVRGTGTGDYLSKQEMYTDSLEIKVEFKS